MYLQPYLIFIHYAIRRSTFPFNSLCITVVSRYSVFYQFVLISISNILLLSAKRGTRKFLIPAGQKAYASSITCTSEKQIHQLYYSALTFDNEPFKFIYEEEVQKWRNNAKSFTGLNRHFKHLANLNNNLTQCILNSLEVIE